MVGKASKVRSVCDRIIKNSILLKPKERMLVTLYYPNSTANNVLGAYVFAYNLVRAAIDAGAEANLITLQSKPNPLTPSDSIYNLLRMTWGFLHTPVDESVYGKFQIFLRELKEQLKTKNEPTDWLNPPDVFFHIAGGRYPGRDIVAASLGFPIPSAPKERWESTLELLNKFWWTPQSSKDKRKPVSRTILTETLPLETYLRTLDVNYKEVARVNTKLKDLLEEASTVRVTGKPVEVDERQFCTELEIDIEGKKIPTDDGVFTKGNNYLNLPAGEAFLTPENVNGTLVVDGSITLDKSYLLEKPLIFKFKEGKFNLDWMVCTDRRLAQKIHRTISWYKEYLRNIKQKKILSEQVIQIYEKNFYRVGELGIGTNPNAKVSKWLIESEKALGTIHVALGSGYEPERKTVHHEDMVAGWKTPLTVEAIIDKKPVKILDKGKLVVD